MNTVYLAALPLWMIILSVALLLSLAIEGGYRLEAWRHNRERNETERVLIGIRSRIPLVIWTLLLLALLGVISVGYQAGLTETRRSPIMLALVLAFTIAMALIADLDRGHAGLLQVSQQSLIDLQSSLETPSSSHGDSMGNE
jgi:hypothetical protein